MLKAKNSDQKWALNCCSYRLNKKVIQLEVEDLAAVLQMEEDEMKLIWSMDEMTKEEMTRHMEEDHPKSNLFMAYLSKIAGREYLHQHYADITKILKEIMEENCNNFTQN